MIRVNYTNRGLRDQTYGIESYYDSVWRGHFISVAIAYWRWTWFIYDDREGSL